MGRLAVSLRGMRADRISQMTPEQAREFVKMILKRRNYTKSLRPSMSNPRKKKPFWLQTRPMSTSTMTQTLIRRRGLNQNRAMKKVYAAHAQRRRPLLP